RRFTRTIRKRVPSPRIPATNPGTNRPLAGGSSGKKRNSVTERGIRGTLTEFCSTRIRSTSLEFRSTSPEFSFSFRQESGDLFETRDSTPCANLRAFQRRGCICDFGDVLERPLFQQSVNEGAVKDVACSCRVNHWNFETRRPPDLAVIAEHSSLRS